MAQNVAYGIARLHVKKLEIVIFYKCFFFLLAMCRAYLVLMHCRRHFVSKPLNTTNLTVIWAWYQLCKAEISGESLSCPIFIPSPPRTNSEKQTHLTLCATRVEQRSKLGMLECEKERVQKRSILETLRDIYRQFKEDPKNPKTEFSSICALRPRNCILAGSAGIHAVYICVYHQNVQLMIDLLGKRGFSHYDLIDHAVGDGQSEVCMMGTCEDCPGDEGVDFFATHFGLGWLCRRWS